MKQQAPGCYGSALTYEEGAPECVGCQFAKECAPLSKASLERIHAKFGIKPRVPKKAPPKANPPVRRSVFSDRWPKKVMDVVERLEKSGVKITEALRNGRNPFVSKPKPFLIACHMLIKTNKGIQEPMLTEALRTKLAYTPESAKDTARLVLQVLEAIGATVETDGIIMIRRNEG